MLRLSTFPSDVRLVPLTGLATSSTSSVLSTDSVIVGLGKLQGQVTHNLNVTGHVYSFTVQFTGAVLTTPQTPVDTPAGWTITCPTNSSVVVQHNLGKQPAFGCAYGLQVGGVNYQTRLIGSGALYINSASPTGNSCTIGGVSISSTAAGTGLSAIIYLIF